MSVIQCEGKRSFASRDIAERVVTRMRRARMKRIFRLNCYLCRFCRRWHVGSTTRPKDFR